MILEMAASLFLSSGTVSTRSASEAARFVEQQAERGRRHLHSSHSLGMGGRGVFDDLCLVADECSAENWDGYGAARVDQDTFRQAYRFLEALPLGTPVPSLGAEADGHLTLEWYRNPNRLLSVSVSPEGTLYYAAL